MTNQELIDELRKNDPTGEVQLFIENSWAYFHVKVIRSALSDTIIEAGSEVTGFVAGQEEGPWTKLRTLSGSR